MSPALERINGRLAVRLETRYARCWLIAAKSLPDDEAKLGKRFAEHLSRRQTDGYAQEDAATLALFELTTEQYGSTLTDASCLPRLMDMDLAPAVQQHRLSRPTFAPMRHPDAGIYPIVDDLAMLESILDAGARIVQLRIKSEKLTPQIDRTIAQAIKLSHGYPDTQLFINDYWQAAIAHGAFGVHLGQEDLLSADLQAIETSGLRLGVSSHAYWEVARALTIAPSYIACGPVFPTRAKVMPWVAQGIDNLAYWTALIPHPVIAIGGIHADNLAKVRATGCACASVIQAIVAAPDPAAAYKQLQRLWDQHPARPTLSQGMTDGITKDMTESIPIASPTLLPQQDL